jgi:endo-1,4-beta-xylanase
VRLINRRQVLSAAIALTSFSGAAANPLLPSLCAVAAERGFRYGAAPETNLSKAPAKFRSLFGEQCALLAPILPWSAAIADGKYYPGQFEANLDYAAQHHFALTGAHLLWHYNLPAWFSALTRAEAESAMFRHVSVTASRLFGCTYSWNVVNEALDPDGGRADGLRQSVLLRQLGPNFIARAFDAARAADNAALLLYNDYGMEKADGHSEAKRRSLLLLLDRLLAVGAPIGGVGLQGHLRISDSFDERQFHNFLLEISGRGLRIVITELDVLDLGAPSDHAVRDQEVADCYERFLNVALDNRATAAVVSWGLSDRHTWLVPTSDPRFRRQDNLPIRPLPFDDNFGPKPAFFAMVRAFNAAPARARLAPALQDCRLSDKSLKKLGI